MLHREQQFTKEYIDEYKMEAASEKGRLINACRWRLVRKYAQNGGQWFERGCGDGACIRAAPDGGDGVGYDPNPDSGYSVWRCQELVAARILSCQASEISNSRKA